MGNLPDPIQLFWVAAIAVLTLYGVALCITKVLGAVNKVPPHLEKTIQSLRDELAETEKRLRTMVESQDQAIDTVKKSQQKLSGAFGLLKRGAKNEPQTPQDPGSPQEDGPKDPSLEAAANVGEAAPEAQQQVAGAGPQLPPDQAALWRARVS